MRGPVIALIMLSAVVAACADAGNPGPATAQPGHPALRITLSSDRQSYAVGQPVALTLTVANTGSAPVTIIAPTAQLYDFAVLRGDQEVWRWGADGAFAAQITEWSVAPGARREFSQTWRPSPTSQGSGDYTAVATLMGTAAMGVQPMRLRIAVR